MTDKQLLIDCRVMMSAYFASPYEVEANELLARLDAAIAQPAAQGEPVAWRESNTPPNCPTITDDEPVCIKWRDAEGRRWTTWCSAQKIGEAVHPPQQEPQGEPVAWYVWSSNPEALGPVCSVTFRKEDVTPMHVPLYANPPHQPITCQTFRHEVGRVTFAPCAECNTDPVQPQQQAGRLLARRILQSDLYAQLDDAERAECDALNADQLAGGAR